MDSAFHLRSAPAARARVVRIVWNCGARLAPDAQIALIVLRQIADLVLGGIVPHLAPGPICEEAHFQKFFPARQAVFFYLSEILARGRLLAPQPREPELVRLQSLEQRLYFAQLTASARITAIQDPGFRFLLLHSFAGRYIHEV